MLCDRPRQEAYRDAILGNRALFAGKTVLDVGAGSGILSIFCALTGAKKVYAVEASNMANIARQVVEENEFGGIVEVHQMKIEDFSIESDEPDQKQVDVIVSEWMGFYLLHEGMLDSVIFARDKFLRADGHMFPQTASILLSPCSLPSLFDAWHNVDGVRLQSFGRALRAQKSQKPEILTVQPNDLLHDGTVAAWLDLHEVTVADLDELSFNEVIVTQRVGRYQGVCIWFDVEFPSNENGDSVTLSTSPQVPSTHWQQTVIPLPDQVVDDVEPKQPIALNIVLRRHEVNPRHYNLEVTMVDPDEIEHSLPCDCILTKCILTKAHLLQTQSHDD